MTFDPETLAAITRGTPAPEHAGSLERYADMRSAFLPHAHDIVVFLPPSYASETERSWTRGARRARR